MELWSSSQGRELPGHTTGLAVALPREWKDDRRISQAVVALDLEVELWHPGH